jgi:uncharacterized protein
LLCALVLLLAAPLVRAQTPIPPSPARWVTDTAGFMSPAAANQLDSRLEAYQRQTGRQLLVWIGTTTGGVPIEDWAVRAFENWKVGRKGIDDGLALFIMVEDRRLRFEVGYGLEGDVADVIAFRIIEEIITPAIRSGRNDEAVTAGMEAIARAIGTPLPGSAAAPPLPQREQARPLSIGQLIVFGILGLVLLFILATNPSLAIWLLANILAGGGGHRRGGGFGGGGFRGGGGRSGGGGASGSW